MKEAADATVTRNLDKSVDKAAESTDNSLFNSAYDIQGPGPKGKPSKAATGGGADLASASLPPVEFTDGGGPVDAGKSPKKQAAHPGGAAGDAPPGGGAAGAGSRPEQAFASGAAITSADGSLKPVDAQYKYSKAETSPKALTMFANDELDLDGNGFVNKVELDRKREDLLKLDAKEHGSNKETIEKLQVVNYMTANYDKLRIAHDDEAFFETSGISIHDLAKTVSDVNYSKRPH